MWGAQGLGVVTVARHSLQPGCRVCDPPGGESWVRNGPEPGIPTVPGDGRACLLTAPRPAPTSLSISFVERQQMGTLRVFRVAAPFPKSGLQTLPPTQEAVFTSRWLSP